MQPYTLEQNESIDKIFFKLSRKNPKQLLIIRKKIAQILENPGRFKPLRSDMKNYREIHVDKHFVLVYAINEEAKTVRIVAYDHHEKIFPD